MTNYGGLVILALPGIPERQLRFLLALETIPADSDDTRHAGITMITRRARLTEREACEARDQLRAAGLIGWTRGRHPYARAAWRINLPGAP